MLQISVLILAFRSALGGSSWKLLKSWGTSKEVRNGGRSRLVCVDLGCCYIFCSVCPGASLHPYGWYSYSEHRLRLCSPDDTGPFPQRPEVFPMRWEWSWTRDAERKIHSTEPLPHSPPFTACWNLPGKRGRACCLVASKGRLLGKLPSTTQCWWKTVSYQHSPSTQGRLVNQEGQAPSSTGHLTLISLLSKANLFSLTQAQKPL